MRSTHPKTPFFGFALSSMVICTCSDTQDDSGGSSAAAGGASGSGGTTSSAGTPGSGGTGGTPGTGDDASSVATGGATGTGDAAVTMDGAASGTGSVCNNPVFVTSDPNGGWSDGGYYVHNNMWNAAYGLGPETLYAC